TYLCTETLFFECVTEIHPSDSVSSPRRSRTDVLLDLLRNPARYQMWSHRLVRLQLGHQTWLIDYSSCGPHVCRQSYRTSGVSCLDEPGGGAERHTARTRVLRQ